MRSWFKEQVNEYRDNRERILGEHIESLEDRLILYPHAHLRKEKQKLEVELDKIRLLRTDEKKIAAKGSKAGRERIAVTSRAFADSD